MSVTAIQYQTRTWGATVAGNAPKYDAYGNLEDSGVAPGGAGLTFVDGEIVDGSETNWTLVNAPVSAASVHLFVLEYEDGPYVRLPRTEIVSLVGTAMTTAHIWGAGDLLADYRY